MTGPIGSIGFSVPLMGANITAKVKAPVVPTPAIQASTRVTLSGASDSISAVYSFGAQKLRANTPAGNSNLSMLMGQRFRNRLLFRSRAGQRASVGAER
ncbi:Uncharacterised protein [Cedecea neteri]|uniref:Uncharacterized protein n=1 Tax=Cedecea neteri TaxID=158822 RepID=A0A2X3IK60_9ENTR|nr:Uncharacterised protein [Cedecea neteri]